MLADIITIGDEILIGQIVDTNSAWMADFLEKNGIKVRQITSVSDAPEHITTSVDHSMKCADVVFVTGGLGPTNDDVTKKTLCAFFEDELVFDNNVFSHIESFFAKRKRRVNEYTKSQALVPSRCKVVKNDLGTAPGMWFENKNKIVVAMPGVPMEMKHMMKGVMEMLKKDHSMPEIVHKTIYVRGIVESHLAEMVSEWESALPSEIKLAYLPSLGCLRLRFTAVGYNRKWIQELIDENIKSLKSIIGDLYSSHQTNIDQEIVGKLLVQNNLTISSAESCTGGSLAKLITSVDGSSNYFKGSVVAYTEEVKEKILGVQSSTIEKHGLVSLEVVSEMALASKSLFQTDYSIATSGIAGPAGGTKENPVGTICFAIATPTEVFTFKKRYSFGRVQNIDECSKDILKKLLLTLEK